ncbi:MAG: hypothetical protein Q9208_003311 [Pyrenodesmia sp. 3 TL-2023]
MHTWTQDPSNPSCWYYTVGPYTVTKDPLHHTHTGQWLEIKFVSQTIRSPSFASKFYWEHRPNNWSPMREEWILHNTGEMNRLRAMRLDARRLRDMLVIQRFRDVPSGAVGDCWRGWMLTLENKLSVPVEDLQELVYMALEEGRGKMVGWHSWRRS